MQVRSSLLQIISKTVAEALPSVRIFIHHLAGFSILAILARRLYPVGRYDVILVDRKPKSRASLVSMMTER